MIKKSIVLSFGGLTGISFLGVLHKIDISNVTHYYGTSAGAIICCLLAIDLTPFEIFVEVCKMTNFTVATFSEWIFSDQNAVASLAQLEHRLCRIFETKIGYIPTFAQLAAKQKFLAVYAYSIDTDESIEFSAETFPDLNIIDAVIASSSIPILFPPRKINELNYFDGCFFCPIPIEPALNKHKPSEIIVIYSVPFQVSGLSSKLSILFKILTISVNWSIARAKSHFTSEMQVHCIEYGPPVITDLSLQDKWELFIAGVKK